MAGVNLIVQLATSTTLSIRCLQGQGQLQDDLRGLPCDQNLRCCRSPLVALQLYITGLYMVYKEYNYHFGYMTGC